MPKKKVSQAMRNKVESDHTKFLTKSGVLKVRLDAADRSKINEKNIVSFGALYYPYVTGKGSNRKYHVDSIFNADGTVAVRFVEMLLDFKENNGQIVAKYHDKFTYVQDFEVVSYFNLMAKIHEKTVGKHVVHSDATKQLKQLYNDAGKPVDNILLSENKRSVVPLTYDNMIGKSPVPEVEDNNPGFNQHIDSFISAYNGYYKLLDTKRGLLDTDESKTKDNDNPTDESKGESKKKDNDDGEPEIIDLTNRQARSGGAGGDAGAGANPGNNEIVEEFIMDGDGNFDPPPPPKENKQQQEQQPPQQPPRQQPPQEQSPDVMPVQGDNINIPDLAEAPSNELSGVEMERGGKKDFEKVFAAGYPYHDALEREFANMTNEDFMGYASSKFSSNDYQEIQKLDKEMLYTEYLRMLTYNCSTLGIVAVVDDNATIGKIKQAVKVVWLIAQNSIDHKAQEKPVVASDSGDIIVPPGAPSNPPNFGGKSVAFMIDAQDFGLSVDAIRRLLQNENIPQMPNNEGNQPPPPQPNQPMNAFTIFDKSFIKKVKNMQKNRLVKLPEKSDKRIVQEDNFRFRVKPKDVKRLRFDHDKTIRQVRIDGELQVQNYVKLDASRFKK